MNYLAASDKEIKDELAKGLSEKDLSQLSQDIIYCVRMICAEIQGGDCQNCVVRFSFSLYGRVFKNKLPLIKRCVNFLMNEPVETKLAKYFVHDLGDGLMEIKVDKKNKNKKGKEKNVTICKIRRGQFRPRRCKRCGYLDYAGGDICPSCEEPR